MSSSTLRVIDQKRPATCSVYLGRFDIPITEAQSRILCDRDLVILDPTQPNVIEAVSQISVNPDRLSHKVGRLNVGGMSHASSRIPDQQALFVDALDQILNFLLSNFQDQDGRNNGFFGVLLTSWEVFPTSILHQLCDVIHSLGLKVYLEIGTPSFLQNPAAIARDSVSGLVIRNGLMDRSAKRKDCFELEAMRVTIKAFVAQSCVREFTVFAWETYDDNVVPSSSVLKRTFTWCSFYNVVPWIGPESALLEGSVEAVQSEPLSAFSWLKDPRVIKIHETWKNMKIVSHFDNMTVVGFVREEPYD